MCNPRLSPLVVKHIGELKEERIRKHEAMYEGHVAELARLREAFKERIILFCSECGSKQRKSIDYTDRKIIKQEN